MQFDWRDFDKNSFLVYKTETEEKYFRSELVDRFLGSIRTGDLCFDLVVRDLGEIAYQNLELCYTLYVGGVDLGYGYANEGEPDEYPYDLVQEESFGGLNFYGDYEFFQKYAEKVFEEFIVDMNVRYKECDLVDKANEPLHVW